MTKNDSYFIRPFLYGEDANLTFQRTVRERSFEIEFFFVRLSCTKWQLRLRKSVYKSTAVSATVKINILLQKLCAKQACKNVQADLAKLTLRWFSFYRRFLLRSHSLKRAHFILPAD